MMCNHSFRPIERMRHFYCFSIPAYFLHWNTVHVMNLCTGAAKLKRERFAMLVNAAKAVTMRDDRTV